VLRINSIIHKGGTHDAHRISILDIFGFEDLGDNSFEQLCINYANESLQLYFNKHVFKLEQAEYARERLEWTHLEWQDNLNVIHLLAKKPVGILHLLDDESNFPRATDVSYLEKCHYNHALNELYSRPRIGAQEFGIQHYAGQVWYNVDGFLEKNRDALRSDVIEMLSTSQEPLVHEMTKQLRAQREQNRSLPRGANGRFITMKPRTPTVAARFSDSLQQLLQSMAKCNPWFVRCVKPNNDKQALKMDMPCVLQQLRYLGMLDTIKIRQKGYPVRLRFQHFVERYRHMLKTPIPRGTPYRDLCRYVLDALPHTNTEGPDFQLGATRVFLREALHRVLENSRADRLKNAAVVIQKNVRKMIERRRMQRKKRGAILIQKAWRGYRHRKQYKNLKKATVKAQALYRGKLERKNYEKKKNDLKRRRDLEKQQKEKAVQKVQKEQQERSQERNQIIHLDVPAELAFIFSKVENWTPVHGDRHLVKVVGTVPGPPMAPEVPNDLDQFAFGKFSSVYCNGKKLQPRRDPISSPFLSRAAARDQDYQDSLAIFKLILRWTGDSNLDGNKDKILADYIVNKGLASKGLRDEILVQLCNQIYGADEHHSQRIWQLMSHCLSSFQPGAPFSKYLMKFISDHAPDSMQDLLLKKVLRNSLPNQMSSCRIFPPTWLEWRAGTRQSDIALGLTLPDGVMQTVAVDSWTTCEEAGSLAISSLHGIPTTGWTVSLDDGSVTDTCALDYILDLVAEKELCPAFPSVKNDLLKSSNGRKQPLTPQSPRTPNSPEPSSPKRPQVPPPEPPSKSRTPEIRSSPEISMKSKEKKMEREEIKAEYTRTDMPPTRKTSHELLSRSSALNDRYFHDNEKSRSRSMDDLLNSDSTEPPPIPEPEPLSSLGLSQSKLNERYHSAERLAPLKQPQPRHIKNQYVGQRKGGSSHSSKQMDRLEMIVKSSAMSDTSESPSLASHVRRVRVPSQASDVDQFLDDLFSPVLDGSLDELSDARSLAASIRGGDDELSNFYGISNLDEDLMGLANAEFLTYAIQGGGVDDEKDGSEISNENGNENIYDETLDEYITDLFQPIFLNENIRNLGEKEELAGTIRGGGTNHGGSSSGLMSPVSQFNTSSLVFNGMTHETFMANLTVPPDVDPVAYQQQMQRAFLESAMAQNIQIQQQLIAQNQALQTLLSQQAEANQAVSPSQTKSSFKFRSEMTSSYTDMKRTRKISSDSSSGNLIPPPPPPPLPPPLESYDPLENRPFIDPYGRAKTVRIGKWRWPPPQGATQEEVAENYIQFKMRQNQKRSTPKSHNNNSNSNSSNESPNGSSAGIEWEEFDVVDATADRPKFGSKTDLNKNSPTNGAISKLQKRSYEIGADRPSPGSVGKLKLSTEMRQRLEQVTAGHSVRSTNSKSDMPDRSPGKLEDARRMMLEQQLGAAGALNGFTKSTEMVVSVKSQVQRMEMAKRPPPPPWPTVSLIVFDILSRFQKTEN
jgi:myosin-15